MIYSKSIYAVVLAGAVCLAIPGVASAQRGGGGGARSGGGHAVGRSGPTVGRAVPRPAGGPVYGPGHYGPGRYYGPARYYGPNRYYGYGHYYYPYYYPRVVGYAPYYPYYYPYRPGFSIGFYLGFGYPYGYPFYGSVGYGYPYGYGPYGYPLPPPGYVSMQPGYSYGGVRIQGAPLDAQVFADGYYIGVVDDFDGPTQHMNLQTGAHSIEIRPANAEPLSLKVNVVAGQTITYHAGILQ